MDAHKRGRGRGLGRRRRLVRSVGVATAALLTIPCVLAVQSGGAATGSAVAYFGLKGGTSVAYRSDGIGGAWFLDPASNLPDVGTSAAPTLVDLDGNGVLDALVGEAGGNVRALRNGGTDLAPAWSARPSWDAPNVGADAAPAAADLDHDGDVDLLVGTAQGDVIGVQNIGTRTAPAWKLNPAWNLTGLGTISRPAAGDVNADGRADVMVGLRSGDTRAFIGNGNAAHPLDRAPAWDVANLGVRITPAAADLNGDRRADLLLINTTARVVSVQRSTGSGFVADTTFVKPPDAGSGPGGLAFAVLGGSAPPPPTTAKPATPTTPTTKPTTTTKPTVPPAPGVVASLTATPATGAAPLNVMLDASGSVANPSGPLTYSWDFGDGTPPPPPADNGARLTQARADYMSADAMRDGGGQVASVPFYMNTVAELLPLTSDSSTAPFTKNGLTTIDKIARYYLSIIGHDLGGIYRFNAVPGFESGCLRYQTAYLYLLESIEQARLGGISNIPAGNGTLDKKTEALAKLNADGCAVPPYRPMYAGIAPPAGVTATNVPTQTHMYTKVGTFTAKVAVSNGAHTASATAQVIVTNGTPPTTKPPTTTTAPTTTPPGTVPPGGGGGGSEPLQGFGASTRGGEGGNEFVVSQPTAAAVKSAITAANSNSNAGRKSKIVFTTPGPIAVSSSLVVAANNLTIEGNGVTLDGAGVGVKAALLEINGHDVIVRNMRLRHGGDNLRAQDAGAYNIVFSHVSVTGGRDDGISIGYGAHDVTVQYSFLAGNSRSIFIKYKGTTNVSLHHNWIQKQWIRGPWAMDARVDFRNNIVEDWAGWGARWEGLASGNVVNSLFAQGPYATSHWGGTGTKALNIIASPVFVSGIEYRGNAKAGPNAQGNVGTPVAVPAVDTQSVAAMEPVVRSNAGAMPRDATDRAYIALTGGWAFNGYDHAPSDFGL